MGLAEAQYKWANILLGRQSTEKRQLYNTLRPLKPAEAQYKWASIHLVGSQRKPYDFQRGLYCICTDVCVVYIPGRSLIHVHFFEKSVDPTKCV